MLGHDASSSFWTESLHWFAIPHLYRKKFVIEEMEGNKVLKRRKGITTKTCVKVASNGQTDSSGKIVAPIVSPQPVVSLIQQSKVSSRPTFWMLLQRLCPQKLPRLLAKINANRQLSLRIFSSRSHEQHWNLFLELRLLPVFQSCRCWSWDLQKMLVHTMTSGAMLMHDERFSWDTPKDTDTLHYM